MGNKNERPMQLLHKGLLSDIGRLNTNPAGARNALPTTPPEAPPPPPEPPKKD